MGRFKLRGNLGKINTASTGSGRRKIHCRSHGAVKWEGHLVCEKCRKVWASPELEYKAAITDTVPEAPEFCVCDGGRTRLLPVPEDPKREPFSARVCCPSCARRKAREDALAAGDMEAIVRELAKA